MTLDSAQRSKIERALAVALAKPDFSGADLWLTYYLSGAPDALNELAGNLNEHGYVNLDGWEGGFLYPKQPCAPNTENIARKIEDLRAVCEPKSIEILHVDLDTSSDVVRSAFQTLIEFAH